MIPNNGLFAADAVTAGFGRMVAVSTWSSFGRNRNLAVPFCRNRNQAETIFLGGFGRNTVTETEFRSVSTSISQQFCSIASLHCRIDPLPISKSSILNGTSELIAPGRRSDESLLCTALYTLWGGRKFYFCLKRTLVRSNISCLQNEDFPF